MHAWESIQKTLETIEKRIGEEMTIEELANEAALSPFYYQRLFSRLVKKPVREYIKLRRLDRACEALRGTENRILDIALDYGFGSHETFTRAFKDTYSINPTEYRESDVRLNSFLKPDLLLNYIMLDLGVPLISEGLVLELNRVKLDNPINFMGVMDYVSIAGHFPNGEATGVNEPGEIWRRFNEIEDKIPSKTAGRKIGAAYHDTAPEGCFPYFAGTEIEPAMANDDFHMWTMPAADYLVVRFEAETFEELVSVSLNKALKYMHTWQRKNGLKLEGFGAEIYYSDTDSNNDGPNYVFMEMWGLWLEGGSNG
jgi:AraC family transcriptional regulator